MPFDLRPATAADAGFLFQLYAATRRQELAAAGWPEALMHDFLHSQHTLRCTHYRAAFPAAKEHIVCVDGAPAGRLLVDRTGTTWRVVDLALVPSCQGRGIGTALLRALQREAAAAESALALQVAAGNPAQGLYRRLGFVAGAGDGVYLPMRWSPPPRHAAEPLAAMPMESLS